jgi:hypothetical protein
MIENMLRILEDAARPQVCTPHETRNEIEKE